MPYIVKVPSIKVTESETSFIKGKQNSNQFKLRSFHSCLPQILLGPSLNTFPQIISPLLTHFRSTFPFYTPRKRQKTGGFLTFSEGIAREDWTEMG